jgi:hypothetical protein
MHVAYSHEIWSTAKTNPSRTRKRKWDNTGLSFTSFLIKTHMPCCEMWNCRWHWNRLTYWRNWQNSQFTATWSHKTMQNLYEIIYFWLHHHNPSINFTHYFITHFSSLWPSSGKIFMLILYFTAIFLFIGQCLQLGEAKLLFVNANANV